MSAPTNTSQSPPLVHSNTPPLVIAFILILVVGFFFAFCVVHYGMCFESNFLRTAGPDIPVRRSASASASPNHNGLDPSLLQNFPSFPYSSVKEYRKQKYGLECAICLLEFEEDSLLRLLTICYHVFHQECIDLWLMTHKTCPVCRRELDSPTTLKEKSMVVGDNEARSDSFADADVVLVDVKDDEDDGREGQETSGRMEREDEEEDHMGKYLRSHSTGHSIILIRRDEEEGSENDKDKYTLRLPEEVKVKLFRGHHYAQSCANL